MGLHSNYERDEKLLFEQEVERIVDTFCWRIDAKLGTVIFNRETHNDIQESIELIEQTNSEFNQGLDNEEIWNLIWELMP